MKTMAMRAFVLGLAVLFVAAPAVLQERAQLLAEGKKLFTTQGCYGCHTIGVVGTPIAPDLSHVGLKYPESYIERWLRDPLFQKPTAHMPKITLTEVEVRALASFLGSLQ